MRRGGLVAVLVVMTMFAACDLLNGSEDPPDTTNPAPRPPGTTRPPPDLGCDDAFRHRAPVSDDLRLLLTACTDEVGRSLQIRNNSAGVLYLRGDGLRPFWGEAFQPTDLAGVAVSSSVRGGPDSAGGYSLLPRASVVASAVSQVRLIVEVKPVESGTAYAATYVANWLESRLASRATRFVQSVSNCAQTAGANLRQSAGRWEDALRTTIQAAGACFNLVSEVEQEFGGQARSTTQVADDILRQQSRVGMVWDDLLKWFGRAATLFPGR